MGSRKSQVSIPKATPARTDTSGMGMRVNQERCNLVAIRRIYSSGIDIDPATRFVVSRIF
jgi:hypothetical protein